MSFEISFSKLQRGPYVKLKFSPKTSFNYNHSKVEKRTEEIHIADLVRIKFKFNAFYTSGCNPQINITTSMSMMTSLSTRDYHVTLKVVGNNFSQEWECPHMYTSWIDIHTNPVKDQPTIEFDVLAIKTETVTFAKLYNDNEVTDFNLITAEGRVAVHKACLAAHSDFFKTMFSSGSWKENESNGVELKGVTMKTLTHLKEYLYLGTLPDSDLESLFLIARCYLIEALKQKCLIKMARRVTSENLYELIEFACENNVPELVIMLFQHTKEEVVYGAQEKPKLQN